MQLSVLLALMARLVVAPDTGAVCYQLEVDPWSLSGFPMRVPSRVRLASEHTSAGLALSPNLGGFGDRSMAGFPRWLQVRPDSVQLDWSSGFTGVTLGARVRGDMLQGRAMTFSDEIGSPQASAKVTGRRIACSDSPAS